jgi:hypothetical protein
MILRLSRLCLHLRFFNKDDGLHRAVALAGSTFDTEIDINVGLGFSFRNRMAFATSNTRATEDTFGCNYVWQSIFSLHLNRSEP